MPDFIDDFDEEITAPEHLKGLITAEIDTIRDVMQLVQMFIGESMVEPLNICKN